MGAEGVVVIGRRRIRFDGRREAPGSPAESAKSISGVARSSVSPMTCDGIEWNTEERLGDLGDFALLLLGRPAAGHRGRSADADDVVAAEGLTAAPDQQRDVRALPAAVGVQLVEDQEAQALRGANQLAVLACG